MSVKKTFTFTIDCGKKNEIPVIKKSKGAEIRLVLDKDGAVRIIGNTKGLQYIAKYILAISMIKNVDGLHIHLDSIEGAEELDRDSLNLVIQKAPR